MKNQKISKSKSLREKMLMIYHDDGILDRVVGATVLMLTAVMAFENGPFIGLIGIPVILYIPIKEKVSIPRIGVIRFRSQEVTRKKLFVLFYLGLAVLLTFLIWIFVRKDSQSELIEVFRNNEVLFFIAILGGTLFAAGLGMNNLRFVVYALLSASLVSGLYYYAGLRVWIAVLITGLFMEAVGIYKLVGFLRANPLESEE
jgi:hypothetical protein